MARIFITGITGFLGSNVADFLIGQNHKIIATYRAGSARQLCLNYFSNVQWVEQDHNDAWMEQVVNFRPEVIIHAAWLGVRHHERDNWESQFANIDFLRKILLIAGKATTTKFIALGSQAEYGLYNGYINETQPLKAVEAYGCVKIICSEMVKQYCSSNKIDWYWLRLFSFFGKGESEDWLIPSLVKKMVFDTSMDFTGGEQKYTYLYANDLGTAVSKIVENNGTPGIYNISGKKLITLKALIETIRDKLNSYFQLNFGKLPYRTNQSMHMQGDSSKFIREYGEFELSNFDNALLTTIEDLNKHFKKRVNESI